MMDGILVLTATGADVKLVNRVLTWLRDWEFGSDLVFRVLRTHNEDIHGVKSEEGYPLQEFPVNEWEGLSAADVEKAMLQREKDAPESRGANHLFLLIDDTGVQDQTIIVAKRAWDDGEDDKIHYLDHYNKVRVPWIEAYIMWCNLDIGNMGFDEFCVEDLHEQVTDFWWHYRPVLKKEHYHQFRDQAEAAVKELEERGLA